MIGKLLSILYKLVELFTSISILKSVLSVICIGIMQILSKEGKLQTQIQTKYMRLTLHTRKMWIYCCNLHNSVKHKTASIVEKITNI